MPAIRDLKSRDRRKRELMLYLRPYLNADDEKELKRVYYINKLQEYQIWCKNRDLEPDLEELYFKPQKLNLS